VTINMNGGPGQTSGPYSMLHRWSDSPLTSTVFHIHEYPVPSDGNCTGTGGHLDPTHRGEAPPCDLRDPASCQVGDLSGKFGTCATLSGCTKKCACPHQK
jgi:hypothetical protein